MLEKYDLITLDSEFSNVLNSFATHHDNMRNSVDYYNKSAFYARKRGAPKPDTNLSVNLLKAFADKNMNYTSKFPTIKVPHKSTEPEVRAQCSMIEKILYATHEANKTAMAQKRWASDATLKSEAIAVTTFNLDSREVEIRRYDPRYCYYKYSNDNDQKLNAFFVAFPMKKDQIEKEFNVTPVSSGIEVTTATQDGNQITVDGDDRYWVIYRWDEVTYTAWVGNKFIQQPIKHNMGFIPVDRCAPFESGNLDRLGNFFLDPLLPLQAEFNEIFRRRSNIVKKLGNPTLWGRGIVAGQWDETKKALRGDGGFIGLKQQGELGFLTTPETKLFDSHLDRLFQLMKDIAGFPTATFGEIAGANTSGDALGMYFQPTTQAVENQWISWGEFYQGINEKILRLYEKFLRADEQKELYGHYPRGTFEYLVEVDENEELVGRQQYATGGYSVLFDKTVIDHYYRSIIITPSATPKDEIAYKRLIMEAVNTNFISHVEGYEEWGIVDPEDSLDLLSKEREDPRLHPDVFGAVTQGLNSAAGPAGAAPPAVNPGAGGPPPGPFDAASAAMAGGPPTNPALALPGA